MIRLFSALVGFSTAAFSWSLGIQHKTFPSFDGSPKEHRVMSMTCSTFIPPSIRSLITLLWRIVRMAGFGAVFATQDCLPNLSYTIYHSYPDRGVCPNGLRLLLLDARPSLLGKSLGFQRW